MIVHLYDVNYGFMYILEKFYDINFWNWIRFVMLPVSKLNQSNQDVHLKFQLNY